MLEEAELLPILRDDLKLLEASASEEGSKNWLLFDPLQNKYFTIGYDAFKLLSLWENSCDINLFLKKINKNNFSIEKETLKTFIEFIVNNKLIKLEKYEDTKKLYLEEKNSKLSFFKWLLHNYLFIRIPIFKPDKWLENNYSKIKFLYSNTWRNIVLVLGTIGIILSLRNLDEFMSTFSYLFSKEGLAAYFLSIIFVKSLHELGHAFTAKRNGAKVPTMGVAFLVLFPLLYTDTTDSWRIKSKYKRLQIVLAGMKVELYLALIATFFWSFLPDGTLKSIAFILATTSWITSLLINISPFLRFDGYYALSDYSDSKNLQPRSFAMARWFLRENILGSKEQIPEYLPKSKQNFFIIYAILTWIYRFFLFLGIAFLVYYFAFKVLGIFLFVVEILWFIILPIYKELKIWFQKKDELSLNKKNIRTLLILTFIVLFFSIPWNNKINMPAVLEAENYMEIYTPYEAKIKEIYIKNGQKVKKGDLLVTMESLENTFSIKQVEKEIEFLQLELSKTASTKNKLDNQLILQEKLNRKIRKKEGLIKIKDSLNLKANFDGIVYKNDVFHNNQWVNPKEAMLTLYDPSSIKLTAFCDENDLPNIKSDSNALFIINSGDYSPLNAKVIDVSNISLPYIDFPELTSDFDGEIAVRQDNEKRLVSEKAYYKIEAKLVDFNGEYKIRKDGVLIVDGETTSILVKFSKQVLSILIRESGF
ncbi:HlyD family efflux transporter periplasmic adaptor subunit [Poseidonibacter lekithochrous]|uniref:HlyD family efflux transporter periplasmic adaptor subunit n=1 Tax=Poseidonibacter lekithochrous TaxID=1904463 RepID=UPI000D389E06|nr:HlyD family efflux transporter periplasmic adaptor subunit [Poseidonibacter lekithochrous]